MEKYLIIVVLGLVVFSSIGYSLEANVNIYKDSQNSFPANVFAEGQRVYLTAYNGVSCCNSISVEIYNKNSDGRINITLVDEKNNGLYKGSFIVGSKDTNDSLDYIHSENNGTIVAFVLFTQLSNGKKEINIDYDKPSVVNITGTFEKGIILNWTSSFDRNGIDRYLIYRSLNNITENDLVYSSKEISFIDKNVVDGKRYYYSVRAVDFVENKGEFSKTIYVDTPDITAPNEINDLFAKGISGGRILLNWSKPYENTEIFYYLVYRSISNDFTNVSYYANVSSEGFVDHNASDNVIYYYSVVSVDKSGNLAKLSNVVSAFTDAVAPKKIDNLVVQLGFNGTVKLSWKVDCNCSFRIYKSLFPINSTKDFEGLSFIETRNMSYSDKLYSSSYYAVVAFDEFMNSAEISNVVRAEPDLIAPSAVKELRIISDPNKKIILSWQASLSSDVAYYAVYRSTDGSVQSYNTVNNTEYIDYDVSNGQTYYYLVRAIDKFGNEDNNTNFVNATAKDTFVLLEISYPVNNSQLSQDRVAIIGRTDADAIVKIKNVINGSSFETDALVDSKGLFIGYAPLGDGFNGIEITTKDLSGNEKKGYALLSNKFSQTSSVSLDNSLENLKVAVYNNTVNNTIVPDAGLITELARNDPNIIKEKNNIENYITGDSALIGISSSFFMTLLAAGGLFASFFSYRVLNRRFGLSKQNLELQLKKEHDEKERIEDVFEKYVDPALVKRFLSGSKEQKTDVSVVVVDIRGFTGLFEKMKLEDMSFLMDKYIEKMVGCVHKNEGVVQKIVGDMVYAIFGVDPKDSDHAGRALKTVIEMRKQLIELNKELRQAGCYPIEVGIAVSTGNAILKSVGSEKSMLYFTAVGEPISIAVKLEEIAKPGEVLISEATYKKVKDQVKVLDVIRLAVRGKTVPVIVYKIKV